jgi:hypothetical protein
MRKYDIKQILIVFISSITLGTFTAAAEEEDTPEDLDLRGSDCISIRTIRDYTPLSRDSLLIHGSAKRSYFVTLFSPRFGVNSSFQLATRSRDDRLCPYGGDALIFGSFQGDEARIKSIKRLNPGQLEQVLIRYGKKEPADKPDPAPPEVKGAEVEELG